MANDAQVKILKEKGVAAWNEWRKANPEIQPDLSGANLWAANLKEADLSRADLSSAVLISARLTVANLSRANLRGANLHGVDLKEADLRGANLGGAKLSEADLFRAYLGEADLREANLRWAELYQVELINVDFGDCIMGGTKLCDVDLSRCKGLETINNDGPSTVGIDTIYSSGGNIPEKFLRGAGVPEPFIIQMKSLIGAMSPIEFYSCFISYSHADKAFARKLHDSLQARGIRCWLDEHQLLPGDDIYHEVDRGIRLWDKMLLCCSEHSLTSWWVDKEIGTAFAKERQLMKERGAKVQVLVPLNLDGYFLSDKWKSGYEEEVRRRLAANFTESGTDVIQANQAKFDAEVERLIQALRADEGAREKPPKARL